MVGARQTSSDALGKCPNPSAAAAADALSASFDNHQFVFIGSTHGDAKIEDFLRCLVSRPGFKRRVTDIVVEWASSGHQRLLDRYLLSLDDLSAEALEPIWFDTDQPTLWATMPQVRHFVTTLREINRTLPAAKRIRLVGGNDGVDWAKVQAPEDLAPYPYRTNLVPHVIVEHLAKTPGNKTLVVYGDAHIRLKGNNFMSDLTEALGRAKLFVVGRIGELVPDERAYLAAIADPNNAFFVEARRFPGTMPWPNSLRIRPEERSPLAEYIGRVRLSWPRPGPESSWYNQILSGATARTRPAILDNVRSAAHDARAISRPRSMVSRSS